MTTQTIPLPQASKPLTTPFDTSTEDVEPIIVHEGSSSTASSGSQSATIFHFTVPEPAIALPTNAQSVGEYVSEQEQDPEWRLQLAEARRVLGAKLFSNDHATLRAMRLARGLSQAQLAAAIGTSQSHIARIETARNDPNYDTFFKLAKALSADIGDVVRAYGRTKDRNEAQAAHTQS